MGTYYSKICGKCEHAFSVKAKEKKQKYCSNECYLAAIHRPLNACKFCSQLTKKHFCSHSCSASFNNKLRTPEMREKQRNAVKLTCEKKFRDYEPKPKVRKQRPKVSNSGNKNTRIIKINIKPNIIGVKRRKKKHTDKITIGEYSNVYYNQCQHSGLFFFARSYGLKYHPDFADLYSQNGRAKYQFTFKVSSMPELFNLKLIEEYGWYSAGGKCGLPINPNGVTRDHKVSISDAIRKQYDPYYIKHPLNCELMLFEENKKKHTKSSISFDELKALVDEYDKIRKVN